MNAYQNLGLAKKLFISLMIIAILGMVIGVLGISATSRLSEEAQKMYQYNTLPMKDLATMYDTLASQRISANNMYQLYYNDFKTIKGNVRAATALGDEQAMSEAIYAMDSMGAVISGYMDEAFALNDTLTSENVQANKELHQSRTIILISSMILGASFAILFAIYLARIIGRPIKTMSDFFVRFGTAGDLSAEIVARIARSSDEQAGAIAQINTGIDQVAQVVQQNSATAEESAAASEEMSGQSYMLEQLISQFKLKDSELSPSFSGASRKRALAMPRENAFLLTDQGGEYGKY